MSQSSRRSVYLADEQWEALREFGDKLDQPVNWVVRQAVTVFLDGYRPSPLVTGAPPTADVVCGCTADTELAAGPGCTVCGHRDHGASGCNAVVARR